MRHARHASPVAVGGADLEDAGLLGKLLLVGGVVATVAGIWLMRRKSVALQGALGKPTAPLPEVIDTRRKNGYTLQHYYDKEMPLAKRVAVLQKLVEESVKDPEMRKLALQLTRKCTARDDKCEMKAIYDAVKARVRYTGDVAPIQHSNGTVDGVDYFASAKRVWELGGGDCDDHSVLSAALLSLNGIPARFRVTAPKKGLGSNAGWQHIYTIAGTPRNSPGKWVALDTTIPGDYFGREVPFGKNVDFVA